MSRRVAGDSSLANSCAHQAAPPSPMAVNVGSTLCSSVATCIRIRPLLGNESRPFQYSIANNSAIQITKPAESVVERMAERRTYEFNHVWDVTTTQTQVHDYFWPNVENNLFNGFNATVMCYGQTGSGKTFTLCNDGLLARLCSSIFRRIGADKTCQYECSVSFIEIYMDGVYDLIPAEAGRRRSKSGGVFTGSNKMNFFEGEKHVRLPVSSVEEVASAFEMGNRYRKTASHDLNTNSSRSHSLFYFHITKRSMGRDIWHSKLTIVDLAGSERVSKTHSSGEVFREAVAINSSLSALLDVIKALASKKKIVVFRQNLLTLHLKDSLLNSYFALICCCSPAQTNLDETLCTLQFGSIAKTVQITRVKNVIRSPRSRLSGNVNADGLNAAGVPADKSMVISIEEYERLVAQLQSNKDMMTRHNESVHQLEQELARRNANVTALTEQVTLLQQSLQQASTKYDQDLRTQLDTVKGLQSQLTEMNNCVRHQQDLVAASAAEKEAVKKQLQSLEEGMKRKEQTLKAQIASLHKDLNEKNYESALKEKSLHELRQQKERELAQLHKQFEADRNHYEQRLQRSSSELERQKSELGTLQADRTDLEKQLRSLNEVIENNQKSKQELQNKLLEKEEELCEAQDRMNELQEAVEETEEKIELLTDQIAAKDQHCQEIERKVTALQSALDSTVREHEREKRATQVQYTELQASNAALSKRLEELRAKESDYHAKLSNMKRIVKESEQEHQGLNAMLKEKQSQLVNAQAELDRAASENRKMNQDIHIQAREKEIIREEMLHRQAVVEQLSLDKQLMEEQLMDVTRRAAQQTNDLRAFEMKHSALDSQIATMVTTIKSNEALLGDLKRDLQCKELELKQTREAFYQQMEAVKSDLRLKERELVELKDERDRLSLEKSIEYEQANEMMTQQLMQLQKEKEEYEQQHEAILRQTTEMLQREKEEYESLVVRSEMEKAQLQSSHQNLNQEVLQLRAQIAEKERLVNELQQKAYEKEMELKDQNEKWKQQQEQIIQEHSQALQQAELQNKQLVSSIAEQAQGKDQAIDELEQRLELLEKEYRSAQQQLDQEQQSYQQQMAQYAQLEAQHELEKKEFEARIMVQQELEAAAAVAAGSRATPSGNRSNRGGTPSSVPRPGQGGAETPGASSSVNQGSATKGSATRSRSVSSQSPMARAELGKLKSTLKSTKQQLDRARLENSKISNKLHDEAENLALTRKKRDEVSKLLSDERKAVKGEKSALSKELLEWKRKTTTVSKNKEALQNSIMVSMKKQQDLKNQMKSLKDQLEQLKTNAKKSTRQKFEIQRTLSLTESTKQKLEREKEKAQSQLNRLVNLRSTEAKRLQDEMFHVRRENDILTKRVIVTQREKEWLQTVLNRALRTANSNVSAPSSVNQALEEAFRREEMLTRQLRHQQQELEVLRVKTGSSPMFRTPGVSPSHSPQLRSHSQQLAAIYGTPPDHFALASSTNHSSFTQQSGGSAARSRSQPPIRAGPSPSFTQGLGQQPQHQAFLFSPTTNSQPSSPLPSSLYSSLPTTSASYIFASNTSDAAIHPHPSSNSITSNNGGGTANNNSVRTGRSSVAYGAGDEMTGPSARSAGMDSNSGSDVRSVDLLDEMDDADIDEDEEESMPTRKLDFHHHHYPAHQPQQQQLPPRRYSNPQPQTNQPLRASTIGSYPPLPPYGFTTTGPATSTSSGSALSSHSAHTVASTIAY